MIKITTIPNIKPSAIPIKRSVKIIPVTVTAKGRNCFQPNLYMETNKEGFANLYPTIKRIAARTDSGVLFNNVGIRITEISNNTL